MLEPKSASAVLLGLFIASWLASGLWTNRAQAGSSSRELRVIYACGVAFCLALGALVAMVPATWQRLWDPLGAVDWLLVLVSIAGMAWCWWARIHIGRLWGAGVTTKEGHHVVDTGPYGMVRHPIYSGGFVLFIPFELIRARPADLLFAIGFIAFFVAKARVEEGFLRQQLGPAYDEYAARVPMLVPRLRRRPAAAA